MVWACFMQMTNLMHVMHALDFTVIPLILSFIFFSQPDESAQAECFNDIKDGVVIIFF